MQDSQDKIHQVLLRYRGAAQDGQSSALQWRAEQFLRNLDWRPRGMDARSVLLIRRFSGLPPLHEMSEFDLEWEEFFRDRLEDHYRQAVRVRGGFIPADANSILFEDEAVLVIHLTDELARTAPDLPTAWYWQQILSSAPRQEYQSVLGALWSQYLRTLPAVFALRPAQIRRYVHLLPAQDAHRLIHELRDVFDLSPLSAQTDQAMQSASMKAPSLPPSREAIPPRWAAPHRAAIAHLPVAVQALIAWGRLLRDDPAFARSSTCAQQLRRWLASAAAIDSAIRAYNHDDAPAQHTRTTSQAAQEDQPGRRLDSAMPPDPHSVPERGIAPDASQPHDVPPPPLMEWDEESLSPAPAELSELAFGTKEGVRTQLGGVLFLYHVLRWLDLPALWDECLSGWAVIEALGRGLLGENQLPQDAIWSLLRSLDGRETDERVGETCEEELPFQVPQPWLDRYGDTLLEAATDDPLPANAATWIAPHAAPWLQGALPIIRRLLIAALATPSLTDDEAIDLILRRPGWLVTSNTHVDLYFSPEDADVRIRRAGLDRDPGWVPALGYIVLFHFSEFRA